MIMSNRVASVLLKKVAATLQSDKPGNFKVIKGKTVLIGIC
jgi:hypothetical protein